MSGLDFEALRRRIEDGTLARGAWTGIDERGRATACALAALWPACGAAQSSAACPADLMRPWLAELIPWLDDAGPGGDRWLARMRRLAECLPRVVALDEDADRKLRNRVGVAIVREAASHVTADKWGVRAACEQAIAALESGDKEQMAVAVAKAEAAAAEAVAAAAWEAMEAARAAAAAGRAAAAEAADAAAEAAARRAAQAADRLADAIVSLLEAAQ